MRRFLVFLFSLCLWSGVGVAHVDHITGVGASLPYPIYAKWASLYYQQTGHMINYQSIGSSGGQQQIIAKTVDFGASDKPYNDEQIEKYDLFQFPAVLGGIVPVVNVPGLHSGDLKLSPKLLSDIFLGHITYWDDSEIVALNPHLSLPHQEIIVIYRSDGSGTTFVFSDYLDKTVPQWHQQMGVSKSLSWPVGQGAKGNEGVAIYMKQFQYAISYIEFSYAQTNDLSWVQLSNQEGGFVSPSAESFQKAGYGWDWSASKSLGLSLTNSSDPTAWPLTTASFILIPKHSSQIKQQQAVKRFWEWVFRSGGQIAQSLDYALLPPEVFDLILSRWPNYENQ